MKSLLKSCIVFSVFAVLNIVSMEEDRSSRRSSSQNKRTIYFMNKYGADVYARIRYGEDENLGVIKFPHLMNFENVSEKDRSLEEVFEFKQGQKIKFDIDITRQFPLRFRFWPLAWKPKLDIKIEGGKIISTPTSEENNAASIRGIMFKDINRVDWHNISNRQTAFLVLEKKDTRKRINIYGEDTEVYDLGILDAAPSLFGHITEEKVYFGESSNYIKTRIEVPDKSSELDAWAVIPNGSEAKKLWNKNSKREAAKKIFGVGSIVPPASSDEGYGLRVQYREFLREWHPDHNPDKVELATEVTQIINAAWNELYPK